MESQNTDLQVYSTGLHLKFTARVTQLRGHNHRADTDQIQSKYRLNREQSRASRAATEQSSHRAVQPQSRPATEQGSHRAQKSKNRAKKALGYRASKLQESSHRHK